jgi:prepilin-type N-terminal cleavage/methylation domain-containing protein
MSQRSNLGFTLVELAIVLVIVALLSGGLMMTLSSQIDQRNYNDIQRQLYRISAMPCSAMLPPILHSTASRISHARTQMATDLKIELEMHAPATMDNCRGTT